jgi:hypothetical protein
MERDYLIDDETTTGHRTAAAAANWRIWCRRMCVIHTSSTRIRSFKIIYSTSTCFIYFFLFFFFFFKAFPSLGYSVERRGTFGLASSPSLRPPPYRPSGAHIHNVYHVNSGRQVVCLRALRTTHKKMICLSRTPPVSLPHPTSSRYILHGPVV